MIGYRHKYTCRRAAGRLGLLLLSVAMLAGFSSCDKIIYDYEGDCSVHYMVRFRYDYNMKFADAFAHEVESVTLYLIDSDGNIVLRQTDEGEALGVEGYEMEVEVDPGQYSLLAWCGTKDNGSFIIPQTDVVTGLTCTLGCKYGTVGPYVDGAVDRLYYGWLEDQEFPDTEGTHIYTVPLIKDTNEIQVVLQHTSGDDPVNPTDFTFTITSDNWAMDWDNSLTADQDATYYAFYTAQGEANMDTKAGETPMSYTFSAAIAEFTISRLVQGHDTRLTVYNSETGETVFSIPLIDYVVMVKGFYNQDMSDQEYLDRQDDYSLVFFLDEGNRWISTYIYVNSWKVVLQNNDL